jgi:hypothetical protein
LQNGIIIHTEKLQKLKASVKLDKDLLLSLEEDMPKYNGHNQLLERYAVEDESKAKVTDLFGEICVAWTYFHVSYFIYFVQSILIG